MGVVCMGTATSGPQFLRSIFYQFLVFPMRSVAFFVIVLPPMAIAVSRPFREFLRNSACVLGFYGWASFIP